MEYKGVVPQSEVPVKQKELEVEANELISKGGKVRLPLFFDGHLHVLSLVGLEEAKVS